MNLIWVVLLILSVRLASVFVVQTYYVADEYWQSLEVAHKLAFGYGYLTWEWVHGVRSYIYPLFFAAIYKVLEYFSLDTVQLLVIIPRILQAILSSYSDYRFYIWSGKKKWALYLSVVPWYWFYTGSRTLLNTVETSLTTIALSYFPWDGEGTKYLWPVAICCFLRPTAAVLWAPLCIYHLRKTRLSAVQLFFKRFLLIGVIVAGICIGIDTYFYGKLIVTPFEFLRYNVLHNISTFYGTHEWHWYFTVGLPTVLGINTLPFLWGTIETIRHSEVYHVRKQLLITILLSLVVLSTIKHKEFRFVTSLLPLCLYISADALTRWSYKTSRLKLWPIALLILVSNVVPAWYLGTIHQKGPIELMPTLQKLSREYRDENNHRASILFLMPCHSTPFYSHVHENVTMRFLTCEPNLQNKTNYVDEADAFYNEPVHWLRSNIPSYPRTAMPSHVVLFQPIVKKISDFLLNYKELDRIEYAEIIKERYGKYIIIYKRLRSGEENTFNRDEFKSNTQYDDNRGVPEDTDDDFGYTDNDRYEGDQNIFN